MKLLGLLTLLAAVECHSICPNITKGMVNTAVTVGSDISLTVEACSGEEVMAWFHGLKSNQVKIWQEIEPDVIQDNRYDVEYPDEPSSIAPEEYKLTVKNASLEMGGKYIAKLLLGNAISSASLVVVESMSTPGVCPPSGEKKQVEDSFYLSCKVTFNGYLTPTLRWEDSNGKKLVESSTSDASDNDINEGSRIVSVSTYVYPEKEDDGKPFHCRLYFNDEDNPYTEPKYLDSCTTFFHVTSEEDDPCNSQPCENGGTCSKKDDGNSYDGYYQCKCRFGYYGDNCDYKSKSYTRCNINPCQNEGTCFKQVDDDEYSYHSDEYWCSCYSDNYGKNCEQSANQYNEHEEPAKEYHYVDSDKCKQREVIEMGLAIAVIILGSIVFVVGAYAAIKKLCKSKSLSKLKDRIKATGTKLSNTKPVLKIKELIKSSEKKPLNTDAEGLPADQDDHPEIAKA